MPEKNNCGLQIIIASGPEDMHRAILGFAMAVSAAVSGIQVIVFLAMRGTTWGTSNAAIRNQIVPGFKSVAEYMEILKENGGEVHMCSTCSELSCPMPVSKQNQLPGLELAGFTEVAIRATGVPTITF